MSDTDFTRSVAESELLRPDELARGALAGDYVIQGTIAAGGCGTVYSATHRVLGRRCAVKVLHGELSTTPTMVERFVREARAVNLIGHPNIVDIYDIGKLDDGRPYYVMELLEGPTLRALLMTQGRLSPPEALELLEPVCAALSAAHAASIVHRDIKASNIAVVTRGDRRIVKLLDFGIAKLLRADGAPGLTATAHRLGTPTAMAPEQILGGQVDARTDVYGLGVLLFQMLTCRLPFESTDRMLLEQLHLATPPPAPSLFAPVSAAVDAVVLRCLHKEQERRFADVGSFLEALRHAAGGARPEQKQASSEALAVAVYVEVRAPVAPDDEAFLDDLGRVLDMSEQALAKAGCALAMQTGTALLGAVILAGDESAARAQRQRALETAVSLHADLASRSDADARLHVNVVLHVDEALVRQAADKREVVGGAIMQVATWTPQENLDAVYVTPRAAEGLTPPDETAARTGERDRDRR